LTRSIDLQRPLYVVGAGHLGTSAPELDRSLNEIFDIAHAWNAVLLIDEADVFLEERSVHDIHRNALVAVFLRQLEYFAGVLFLTTNRVTTFDHAFQSRIHVALHYRDLDRDARLTIWRAFLTKNGAVDSISNQEWESLGTKKVNGRQIKNAVNTAKVLAHSKGENLNFAHVNEVLSVMDQFDTIRNDRG
jgi:SpoVK/Ycf46/Vps4 family AAA+-type ATPase